MASFNHIDVQQLLRRVGPPDAPLILDVRLQEDVDTDPTIIPGAQRIAHTDISSLAALPNAALTTQHGPVVYCQKGRKLSQGVAAVLRAMGIRAEALDGGHFAWRDAKAPLIPLSSLASQISGASRLDRAPECSGFLAALLGLSREHRDATQQLDAAMPVLDPFYRWARDASDEPHDCPRPVDTK